MIGRKIISVAALMLCFTTCWVNLGFSQTGSQTGPRYIRLGGWYGAKQYSGGDWGAVFTVLANPTDHPVDLLVSSYFAEASNLQYGRSLWLPENSVLKSWYHVRPPTGLQFNQNAIELKSMLYDRTDGKEDLLRQKRDQVLHSTQLPVDEKPLATGLIPAIPKNYLGGEELDFNSNELPDEFPYEAVVSLRLTSSNLDRRVRRFDSNPLPPTATSLEGLDRLVISSDRVAEDAAAMKAVRGWVREGGMLWIMLDQISAETSDRLFGEAVDIEIVDRLSLTEMTFHRAGAIDSQSNSFTREVDRPIDFLRVLANDVEVEYSINGWPASFWKSYGRGKVLFTTLGPEGWIRERTDEDPEPARPDLLAKFIALTPFVKTADTFYMIEEKPDFELAKVQPILGERIGYSIVDRGPVLAVLGTFCGLLLVIGIWLYRRERLERLGLFGPVAALFAALALIAMGMQSKQSVVNTTAVAQIVDLIPGSNEVSMTGLMAIYNQAESTQQVGVERGGKFQPDFSTTEGTTHRMIWSDYDSWHWENLVLPGGAVTSVPFSYSGNIESPIEAWGTFDADGFRGKLTGGSLGDLGDAFIMNAVQPGVPVEIDADGTLTADKNQVFAPGQFLADSLLDDEQRRRQEICRLLFPAAPRSIDGPKAKPVYFDQPTLIAWAAPLATRFYFPDNEKQTGSAILKIPLSLEKPQPGTEILIPTTFLKFRDIAGPNSLRGSSQTYSDRTGQWVESKAAARTWLRFEVPKAVLPLTPLEATLTLNINAPARKLEIEGLLGEELVVLDEQQSPVGKFSFNIDRADVLKLDDQGAFVIGIHVGEAGNNTQSTAVDTADQMIWQIESMQIDLRGKTPPQ